MKNWGIKRAKISDRNRSLDGSWEVTYTATPPFFILCDVLWNKTSNKKQVEMDFKT